MERKRSKEKSILTFEVGWEADGDHSKLFVHDPFLEAAEPDKNDEAAEKACKEYSYELSESEAKELRRYYWWDDNYNPKWFLKCVSDIRELFVKHGGSNKIDGLYFWPSEELMDEYTIDDNFKIIDNQPVKWTKELHKEICNTLFLDEHLGGLMNQSFAHPEGMKKYIRWWIGRGIVKFYRNSPYSPLTWRRQG